MGSLQQRSRNLLEAQVEGDMGFCVHRMVVDPSNSDRLFQQFHFGVYKSENAGDTWERIENGLPRGKEGSCSFPIVMHPDDPDTLMIVPQISGEYRYAHEGELAVYKTTDAGDLPAHSESECSSTGRLSMAKIPVELPSLICSCTGGEAVVKVEASTLSAALDQLTTDYPLLRNALYESDGAQRKHVLIFYNDENTR